MSEEHHPGANTKTKEIGKVNTMTSTRAKARTCLAFTTACVLILSAGPVNAQKNRGLDDITRAATAATIDSVVEQAVRNLAIRYSLNVDQEEKTMELMRRRVYQFLEENEEHVWPVLRDLVASGGRPPENGDMKQSLGKATLPLFKLAKEAILEGNNEWRNLLSDEQKKMHDWDLANMANQFEQIDSNLKGWSEGKDGASSIWGGSPSPKEPVPARPTTPRIKIPDPVVQSSFSPTVFEAYVEQFINDYELNEGQRTSALSILNEYTDKVKAFQKNNDSALSRLASQRKSAHAARDKEKMAKLDKDRNALLRPIYVLFAEMDERLKSLLTSAQVATFDDKNKDLDPDELKRITKRSRTSTSKKETPKKGDTPDS